MQPLANHSVTAAGVASQQANLQRLPRRTYPLRVLGMGLATLPAIAVLYELGAGWTTWAWVLVGGLLWPHLAFQLARRSADPLRVELRNFALDSIIAGSWVALIQFNLLPAVVLLSVVSADKINTGIRGLWLRSLPGMAAAIVIVGLFNGMAFTPHTSMLVMVSCLPLMVIHTLAVSVTSYRLIRRVQLQNLQLEQLSRIDTLTGIDSRGYWEGRASQLLQQHAAGESPATLMLMDIDSFKTINDRFGHVAGDDALREIAQLVRACAATDGLAGRIGGDEFALALPCPVGHATARAESLREKVEQLTFAQHPGMRCSISIGIAAAPAGHPLLRDWMELADHALYRAKDAGRNRICRNPAAAAAV